jgi:murein DD-endopeptidase MepM/ murein hydrolase activator NlpD
MNESSIKDTREFSKKIETVFLTEMLKVMLNNTSLTKERNLSTYMTVLIPEIATMMAEREMGLGRFLTENLNLKDTLTENGKIELKPIFYPSLQEKITEENKIEGKISLPKHLFLPVKGEITSRFGLRIDPIDGKRRHHNGIDIAVPEGTKINPVLPGKVIYSGYSKGYGNCVIVEHEGRIQTVYAHNLKNLVKVGDLVSSDTVIALSGSTGRTTGPHLHFEVRRDGKPIDPLTILNNSQKKTIV